jgi:ABC-type hemin transport system ATPase subunit
MRAGRIVAAGTPEDVLTSRSLSALYDVAIEVVELPISPGSDRTRRICFPVDE